MFFVSIEDEGLNVYLHFVYVQVDGKLAIPMGVFCFENICSKCHLPSLTSKFYYYGYNCMVTIEIQTQISCKIKQNIGDEYDCVLCDPWIKSLLGYDLVNPEDFELGKVFSYLFIDKILEVDLH
jgi:hypothetical protein